MIQPATVRGHLAAGYRLAELWCNVCQHHTSILVDGLPLELPLPDIALRAKCTACGSRNVTSRGDVREFYAVLSQRHLRTPHKSPDGVR